MTVPLCCLAYSGEKGLSRQWNPTMFHPRFIVWILAVLLPEWLPVFQLALQKFLVELDAQARFFA